MTDPQGNSGVLYRPALDAPGAQSMRHVRSLLEDRITSAVPDQSLIVSGQGTDAGGDTTAPPDLRCATRDRNGRWAMVYTTVGKGCTVDMAKLRGAAIQARWYDPREGTYLDISQLFPVTGTRSFDPPGPEGKECDWVLVLQAS